jgi:hypothetical protein
MDSLILRRFALGVASWKNLCIILRSLRCHLIPAPISGR